MTTIFRACAPALSVTGCCDYYVRSARVRAFNQRHVRAARSSFECGSVTDVSALLRCLLGFGTAGCALGWRADQFPGNENRACAGNTGHHLDSRSRNGSRVSRDWNCAGAFVCLVLRTDVYRTFRARERIIPRSARASRAHFGALAEIGERTTRAKLLS